MTDRGALQLEQARHHHHRYYYVVGPGSAVPTATSTFIGSEALALVARPGVGKTFVTW